MSGTSTGLLLLLSSSLSQAQKTFIMSAVFDGRQGSSMPSHILGKPDRHIPQEALNIPVPVNEQEDSEEIIIKQQAF